MKEHILMISSGMKKPKKDFNLMNKFNLYLNYGLLGLATNLYNKGYTNVKVIQGDYDEVDVSIQKINELGIDISKLKYPVFISIPSFISLSWAIGLVEKLKIINKDIKIVAGGRWVVDNNIEWLKGKVEDVDFFATGYGEEYIEDCLYPDRWDDIEKKQYDNVKEVFNEFNYNLLHDYNKYQPCVEISRGCGNGCEFCLENKQSPLTPKDPIRVIKEAIKTCDFYGDNELNFYFQASIFNPTLEWSKKFYEIYHEYKAEFKWRFETRVDTLNEESIKILSKAGLKVIDLGIESASEIQLKRMKKTKNPKKYLQKAENLIRNAHKYGIWIKLNILLFPGENNLTLNQTLNWMEKNRVYFKGISVNPLIIYRNGKYTEEFVKYIKKYTTKNIDISMLETSGYMFIDLSEEIDLNYSQELSLNISRRFMDIDDYMDLKSISYFSRETNYEELRKYILSNKKILNNLPFVIGES